MLHDYRDDWRALGRDEPYFGVLTDARFLRGNLGDSDSSARQAFWDSGEVYVATVAEFARRHLERELRPAVAVDFGCGVGRLVLPLAARCGRAIGVDIAAGMLAEARAEAERRGLRNVELREWRDDWTALPAEFDFVNCFAVLQHVPERTGLALVAGLLDRLAPGGLAALHFAYALPAGARPPLLRRLRGAWRPLHRLANLAAGRPWRAPHMQMNTYDVGRVFATLQSSGCHRVFATFTEHGGVRGTLLLAEKTTVVSL